ncbi:MAG: calcium-binding protein [Alphaproteobacteria bacterium]|nr:calcium-binding protein [Alphaproteobacteria bacterium]
MYYTTQTAYLTPSQSNVRFDPILSVGDVAGTKADGTPWIMVGIPDGLGAFDNGNGTVTVLMNHEISNTLGVVRDHGAKGTFVSQLIIDKTTWGVVSGSDAVSKEYLWNSTTKAYELSTTALSRFCSGDLAPVTAFYDAATGLGTQSRLFLTGEETGAEGRAVAVIATGSDAGSMYELPKLGNLSFENVMANPYTGAKTVVMSTDDTTPGQVYMYVGTKQSTGSTLDKAGLTNGSLYGVKADFRTHATALLDGTEGQVMFDNLTVSPDGTLVLQEDPGGFAAAAKIWHYDPNTDKLTEIARHDSARFGDSVGGTVTLPTAPFTNDDETSGVIDVTDLFGSASTKAFLVVSQAHYAFPGANGTEVVEGGQLQLMTIATLVNGSAAADTITGTFVGETINALANNDSITGGGGNDTIDGGAGTDTVNFSGAQSAYRIGFRDGVMLINGADGMDQLTNVEQVKFGTAAAVSVSSLQGSASDNGLIYANIAGKNLYAVADAYTGPVSGLVNQFLGGAFSDSVLGTEKADFINTGAGNDAINGAGGNDVIDGGLGSNFITGGAGTDKFFVDGRAAATSNTWSTITDWTAGESLTIWGYKPNVSKFSWVASDGATGFKGVTLHADLDGNGGTDTSVTWAGLTQAQLPTVQYAADYLFFG